MDSSQVQQIGTQVDLTSLITRIYERILAEGSAVDRSLDDLVETVVDEEIDRELENRLPNYQWGMFARYLLPQECCDALCQEIKKIVSGYQFQETLRRAALPPN